MSTAPADPFDIVVIGASAGGVKALQQLVGALPAGYRGAVFVVVHTSPESTSELAAILARSGPMAAETAADDTAIAPGQIRTAPSDHHLLLEPGRMRVLRGPRENRHRPAIDPLFRSAAAAYGHRVVAIVLSGNLDDGTAGLWAVKSSGGTTVVQEPDEADFPDMPMNALKHTHVDHRLRLDDIAALLAGRVGQPGAAPLEPANAAQVETEVGFDRMIQNQPLETMQQIGTLSSFTCPSCGGALWELDDDNSGALRYRCHTGHAFSPDSLMIDQGLALEENLYSALRAVQEKAAALRRMAERWSDQLPTVKQDYLERADGLDRTAEVLRRLLAGPNR